MRDLETSDFANAGAWAECAAQHLADGNPGEAANFLTAANNRLGAWVHNVYQWLWEHDTPEGWELEDA